MATPTERLDALNSRLDRALDRLPASWRKPALFGLWGGVGCFLGALLLGEILLLLLMPGPPGKPRVDVLFVLDVTGSMQFAIDGVRDGIADFAEKLATRDLDSRVGLVAFRDKVLGEEPRVLRFDGGAPLTADIPAFRTQVAGLGASGGGDTPESSLDALALAAAQPFREGATRVLVLVTDAPPKLPDGQFRAVGDVVDPLKSAGIGQVHLVVKDELRGTYEPVQREAPGKAFSLDDAARSRGGFEAILPELGHEIADATLRGLQSGVAVSRRSFLPLILATAAWTAALAIGLALALIAGQNLYLKKPPLPPADAIAGGLGGAAAGLVAGAAGQFLYQLAPFEILAPPLRLVGWTLLGALVGGGMSRFVPNLDRRRALQGGALGGALGCLAFLVASTAAGDVIGRLLGASALGVCVGLMVGLVEVAFREAWLEVAYGPDGKEKRTVSLGREAVAVGSDRACKVWARDAAPVAYRYKLEAGKVTREDVEARTVADAVDGDRRDVGKLTVTVRTSAGARPKGITEAAAPVAAPATAAPPRAAAPRTPTAPPAPVATAAPRPSVAPAPPAPPRPSPPPPTTGPPLPPPRRPVAPPPPPPKPGPGAGGRPR